MNPTQNFKLEVKSTENDRLDGAGSTDKNIPCKVANKSESLGQKGPSQGRHLDCTTVLSLTVLAPQPKLKGQRRFGLAEVPLGYLGGALQEVGRTILVFSPKVGEAKEFTKDTKPDQKQMAAPSR